MARTVGDFFWQRLHDWGACTVFGYPGDGINGLLGAMNRAEGAIELIQVRHEEMADTIEGRSTIRQCTYLRSFPR